MAFYATESILPKDKKLSSTLIKPILFLSKLLMIAEKNYWPTKLEIAGFVWVIKKLKYLVESSCTSVII